jgi:hypothetical protein
MVSIITLRRKPTVCGLRDAMDCKKGVEEQPSRRGINTIDSVKRCAVLKVFLMLKYIGYLHHHHSHIPYSMA